MGENTKIEWADHSWNPWIGCQKVSPACDNCYAEAMNDRFKGGNWGPKAPRRRTSESNWKKPLSWNRKAEKLGIRYRVFCASMADVFDNAVPTEWRDDLWDLIRATPHLDWLLLTKRPQNIKKMISDDWGEGYENVWLGTTVENQKVADQSIPIFLDVPAKVHFLSVEPMLETIEIRKYLHGCNECQNICGWRSAELDYPPEERCDSCGERFKSNGPEEFCTKCNEQDFVFVCPNCDSNIVNSHPETQCIDWIICGGESGPISRPMNIEWVRDLRDQCVKSGTPFLFKQWGGTNKKKAGRILDGRTWDEFPEEA